MELTPNEPISISDTVGVAGTSIRGGRFMEEYLTSLRMPASYAIYDRMRRSDYQIRMMLLALKTPILGADFCYTPEDGDDEEQVKQAAYKNKFFKEWPAHKWNEILTEILSALDFGFSIFEPYFWLVDDPELGKVWTLRSLGFMKQSTISAWSVSKGTLNWVQQVCSTEDKFVDVKIPGDQVLVFSLGKEGDNYEGISVLRGVYGNYIRKDLYLQIDMTGIEKMAIGTPTLYLPPMFLNDAEKLSAIKGILEAYVANQCQYFIWHENLKDKGFEIIRGEYNSDAVNQSIEREDKGIVQSVLAQFLTIGTQRAGGNAQNDGHQGLFLDSLVYFAKYIAEKLDNIVHAMYVFNFGIPKVKLYMHVSGITKDSTETMMRIIRGYATANIIRPDDRLETAIRESLDLPDVDENSIRESKPDYNASVVPENIPDAQAAPRDGGGSGANGGEAEGQ